MITSQTSSNARAVQVFLPMLVLLFLCLFAPPGVSADTTHSESWTAIDFQSSDGDEEEEEDEEPDCD